MIFGDVFRYDPSLKVFDVAGIMKGGHLVRLGLSAIDDMETGFQVESFDEGVCHFDSSGFHEVIFTELEVGDILVIEIDDFIICHLG